MTSARVRRPGMSAAGSGGCRSVVQRTVPRPERRTERMPQRRRPQSSPRSSPSSEPQLGGRLSRRCRARVAPVRSAWAAGADGAWPRRHAAAPAGQRDAEARRRPPTSPTPTRSSTGRTGRCTWTTTTRPRPTRRSSEFEKQTGIKATYAEDIDDNDTYYGKIQGQLKNGHDIGKDIVVAHRLDGRADDPPGLHAEARQGHHPERQEHPRRPARRRLRPGPQALPDLAVRLRGPGLEQEERCPGRRCSTCPTCGSPSSRAASRCSPSCATRSGLIMLEQGVDICRPTGGGRVRRRARGARGADRHRPDPPGEGQLLQGGPDLRRRARRHRLVRRHHADQLRERRQVGVRASPRPAARSGATT